MKKLIPLYLLSTIIFYSCACSHFNSVYYWEPDTVYVVGNSGEIYKSVDRGNYWDDNSIESNINLYAVYFTSGKTGYILGGEDVDYVKTYTIFKTTDGGYKWERTYLCKNYYLDTIYFINADTGIISGDTFRSFLTTNSGTTWLGIRTDELRNFKTYEKNNNSNNVSFTINKFGRYKNKILRSTDGGKTWKIVLENSCFNPVP